MAGRKKATKKQDSTANLGCEAQLWQMADALRGSMKLRLPGMDPSGSVRRIGAEPERILRKYGYPPDMQEKVTQTVLEQAALLSAEWVST